MHGTLIDYLSNSRMGPSRITVWVTKEGEVVLGGQGIPAPGITVPRGTSVAIEVGTEAYRGSDVALRTRIVRETLPADADMADEYPQPDDHPTEANIRGAEMLKRLYPVPVVREWLVIESACKNAVFASDEERRQKGYIPRDVAEPLLGRVIEDGPTTWFTREESEKMRAHPAWRDTEPPELATRVPGEVDEDGKNE